MCAADCARAPRRRADRPRRLRLGARPSAMGRAGAPPQGARTAELAAIGRGDGGRARRRRPRGAGSTQEGMLAELPRPPGACSSRAPSPPGGCSSTSWTPTSSSVPHARARTGVTGRGSGRPRVTVSRPGVRGDRRARPCGFDGPETVGRENCSGSTLPRRPRRRTPRLSQPSRPRRVSVSARGHHIPRTSASRTTAGTCHGVIKRIAPQVDVIHITQGSAHEHPPGLRRAGQHAAVHARRRAPRDRRPRRRHAASRARRWNRDDRLLVGPDNGLLVPAAERLGGIAAANEITNREYALEPIAPTFHGRDIFSPAAAHLALGLDSADLGGAVKPTRSSDTTYSPRSEPKDPRDLPLRRPVREHPAKPHGERRRTAGHRAGKAGRGRAPGRSLLRSGCENVRRRQAGRHHPLPGRLPEHRARDLPRQRRQTFGVYAGTEVRLRAD